MSESSERDSADDYLVEQIRDALANDARIGELEINVAVSQGRVLLTGVVHTPERQSAIDEVVSGLGLGLVIQNETTLVPVSDVSEVEKLE